MVFSDPRPSFVTSSHCLFGSVFIQLRSVMEKLENGQANFSGAERELLERLKKLSLGSERRLDTA